MNEHNNTSSNNKTPDLPSPSPKKRSISEMLVIGTLTVLIYLIPWVFTLFTEEYYEIAKNSVLLFGIAILIMVWGVITIIKKKVILYKTPIDLSLFLIMITVILSAIFSINSDTSVWGYHMRLSGGLISNILLFIIFYLTLNAVREKRIILFLLKNVVFSITLLAIFTFLKAFNVFQGLFSELIKQNSNFDFLNNGLFSPTGNTNSITFLFILILPFVLFLFINKKNAKVLDLILGTIISIVLISTISITSLSSAPTFARISAWVVMIGLLFLNIVFSHKFNKGHIGKILINITILILALLSFGATSDGSISQKLAEKVNFSRYYEIPLDTSWSVISGTYNKYSIKSFFIGTGLDTYAYVFPQFRTVNQNNQPNWFENYTRSNTQIESVLVNTGIFGLLSFLLLSYVLINFCIRKIFIKENWDNNRTLIGLGLFALIFIVSFFTTYHTITFLFISWICLALLFKLYALLLPKQSNNSIEADFEIITNKETNKMFNIAPYLFTSGVILVSLVIIFTTTANFIAETYYSKALKLSNETKYDEAYDNLVYAVNINNQRDYYHKEIASVALSKLTNIIDNTKKDEGKLTDTEKNQLLTTQQYLLTLINSEINKSILLNPENHENWQRAALIYKKLTELAEGKQFGGDTLKAIEESINRNPTNPDNFLLLGYLYQYNSDTALQSYAENAYLKAYDLQPSYALSIIQLGSYFEYVEKYSDAMQLYTISKENVYSTESSINKYLTDKIEEMKKLIAEKGGTPTVSPTPKIN